MTRVSVYASVLAIFVAVTVMTIVAIVIPNWVYYSVHSPSGDHIWKKVGLHKSCANTREPQCEPFPYKQHCEGKERYFCNIWRTVAFVANFAAALHFVAIITFIVLIKGGKQRREFGWKVLGGFLVVIALVEYFIIGAVSYIYDNDEEFLVPGWHLDTSWYLATVSASVSLLCAVSLAASHYLLPPEGGYEFLFDIIEPRRSFES